MTSFSDAQTVDLLYFYLIFFAENKKEYLATCNQYPLPSPQEAGTSKHRSQALFWT